ncbi:hypothetical protein BDB01DRAFT_889697 [Pilobolus umbonatus]|nr:hypothetical protein BDB01DRAFT_889697 [Pilobolus umbonatus]
MCYLPSPSFLCLRLGRRDKQVEFLDYTLYTSRGPCNLIHLCLYASIKRTMLLEYIHDSSMLTQDRWITLTITSVSCSEHLSIIIIHTLSNIVDATTSMKTPSVPLCGGCASVINTTLQIQIISNLLFFNLNRESFISELHRARVHDLIERYSNKTLDLSASTDQPYIEYYTMKYADREHIFSVDKNSSTHTATQFSISASYVKAEVAFLKPEDEPNFFFNMSVTPKGEDTAGLWMYLMRINRLFRE